MKFQKMVWIPITVEYVDDESAGLASLLRQPYAPSTNIDQAVKQWNRLVDVQNRVIHQGLTRLLDESDPPPE